MNKKIEIVYEDKYLVVVHKAHKLLSVPYEGVARAGRKSMGNTVLDILETIQKKRGRANSLYKPCPVHRLDKETSGVMMFAFGKEMQKKIMNNWHTMVINRCYCALAETNVSKSIQHEGQINKNLSQNKYNRSFVSADTGQVARTQYKIIIQDKKYTLFELELDTGRKNQIRAHLAWLGFPIAGDFVYNAHTNPFNRLCLHAKSLEFIHPVTQKKMAFTWNEPSSWGAIIR